ncbi:SPOSA6832_03799 [Sporobolomyces salmonicolor]|uniref:SPOSA6832_03799-mRNA-1:cds n=1 Tax=Sporidiobolus salmonicolor TaxID=5005 RepID=A0A0D6EPZ7_SPOSA|nr:SPOSA6832_03799 [Sporobolomyces salmonicolor]
MAVQAPVPPSVDNTTQSNFHDIRTTHLSLDWTVDCQSRGFLPSATQRQQQIIRGSVTHSLTALKDGVDRVIFDSSYLSIKRCFVVAEGGQEELTFDLSKRHKSLGSALTVQLPKALKEGNKCELKIEYGTTDSCTALGWLTAEQTDSGKYPFLYSQCQAIHCRSLIPCQDTPSVKLTYSAVVHSTLPILLSARRTSPPPSAPQPAIDGTTHTYKFDQPIAIPSYLVAVAGGELAFKALGERTGIWAEPGVLGACAWEFEEDAEKIVKIAEELVTPYAWGRYDALVLPSSFPYGGMENPQVTFLTPALVGWTTYTERLIALRLHGPAARDFEYIIGAKSLQDDLKRFNEPGKTKGQRLHIPYEFGEDPDDLYSGVAYDKGANFLLYLEQVVGGLEIFSPYQKAFVERFWGLSISTQDWLDHFWSYWAQYPEKERILRETVDWDAWLHGEGLELPVKMSYDTSLADNAYTLAASWDSARSFAASELDKRFSKKDIDGWSATQFVLFMETMGTYPSFEKERHAVEALDRAYGVMANKNPEIKLRWFLFVLKAGMYSEQAAAWVKTVGRMKYVRPIYRALDKVDHELAKKTFLASAKLLHPIARQLVARDLGLEK